MDIRELGESDLDDLLDLYTHMHAEDDPLPDEPVVASVWREIQTCEYLTYYGVFIEGRLVSSCNLTITPNLSRGCRPYALIENVVTHSEHRRKGYASAVLKFALNEAWRKNCYKTMLLTGRKNERIFQFYENVGFDRQAKQAFLAKP